MKVAVVGLGAVGGLIASRLAQAGHDVSALARGRTLAAVRERGLVVEAAGSATTVAIRVSDDARELGPQELVVIALKAPSLPAAVAAMAPLVDSSTLLLPAMNGVPWWFMPAADAGAAPLDSVDPGGRLAAALPIERTLGCVVHVLESGARPGSPWLRPAPDRRRAGGRRHGTRRHALCRSFRCRFPGRGQRRCAPRGLVQVVGQHDDEPGLGTDGRTQ
jgi:hypothetical protein